MSRKRCAHVVTECCVQLKSNAITDDGAYVIAEMLKKNRTLTYLNVGNQADKMNSTQANLITDHVTRLLLAFHHSVSQ